MIMAFEVGKRVVAESESTDRRPPPVRQLAGDLGAARVLV